MLPQDFSEGIYHQIEAQISTERILEVSLQGVKVNFGISSAVDHDLREEKGQSLSMLAKIVFGKEVMPKFLAFPLCTRRGESGPTAGVSRAPNIMAEVVDLAGRLLLLQRALRGLSHLAALLQTCLKVRQVHFRSRPNQKVFDPESVIYWVEHDVLVVSWRQEVSVNVHR